MRFDMPDALPWEFLPIGTCGGSRVPPQSFVSLEKIFLDQVVPTLLCLENGFDRFAHGPVAAASLRDELRRRPDLFAGVGHRHAESDGPNDGQVGQVIPQVANLFRLKLKFRKDRADGREFVLGPLTNDFDPQFGGPQSNDVRVAAGDKTASIAGFLPELDSHSVANVKPFDLDPLIIKDHAAIGENAVDVAEDQLDGLTTLFERHVRDSLIK